MGKLPKLAVLLKRKKVFYKTADRWRFVPAVNN